MEIGLNHDGAITCHGKVSTSSMGGKPFGNYSQGLHAQIPKEHCPNSVGMSPEANFALKFAYGNLAPSTYSAVLAACAAEIID